jgi:hypothetical protein
MAKLLQRVRGGAPYTPEPTSLRHSEPQQIVGPLETPNPTLSRVDAPQVPTEQNRVDEPLANEEHVTTSLGTVRRKASVNEPPANLEAFRALANESARRAIGTHALRIHRRNAVTKTIVAILAGFTSVWIMLGAPHWRDLEFLSACVLLLVAAYWAGQTFGTLVEAFRAASYDGPRNAAGDPADPFRPPLPIDVEKEVKRQESRAQSQNTPALDS